MIDVKTAVGIAVRYIQELLPKERLRDLRLEEVERTDDNEHWLVTLGYSTRTDPSTPFEALGGPRFEREYKVFKVSAQSGEVTFMKIRTVE